jgi:hypothetical protein
MIWSRWSRVYCITRDCIKIRWTRLSNKSKTLIYRVKNSLISYKTQKCSLSSTKCSNRVWIRSWIKQMKWLNTVKNWEILSEILLIAMQATMKHWVSLDLKTTSRSMYRISRIRAAQTTTSMEWVWLNRLTYRMKALSATSSINSIRSILRILIQAIELCW